MPQPCGTLPVQGVAMSRIRVERSHTLGREGAREKAERLAERLASAALEELQQVLSEPEHPLRQDYARWVGEYIGSPPLHSSSSPSSWLQWMTTSSPTFQRFTLSPTAQTMPEASDPAM